jgi:hypothetical protein
MTAPGSITLTSVLVAVLCPRGHFVPWSRYPDDTLDGLWSRTTGATDHLSRWKRRFVENSAEYGAL